LRKLFAHAKPQSRKERQKAEVFFGLNPLRLGVFARDGFDLKHPQVTARQGPAMKERITDMESDSTF